ncbi:extracellular solute-binding protein [Saccharopolyspora sp. K220]|uniref:sugar ABC transporter substrate-binding protein n=1 Tax=Saccharopolyspora soli TaxID=2926618 RepID=UPI001F57011D|nr:extracellular solute-binding protein [Saccharopolyspora soli]MCI2420652.1 extracellular solute-binding protein [Saccharopolyspora soli]
MRPSLMRVVAAVATAGTLFGASACGSGFDDSGQVEQNSGPANLTVLISTSGTADLNAVRDAANAWAARTGSTVTVNPANDMNQQLSQGFASGNPPDVFMVDATKFAAYAQAGNLLPYGDSLPYKDDLYPTLRQTFTYQDQLYCAPKDFSTLALQINTDAWTRAGLTDADIPKTWEQLESVARRLTTGGQTGLVFNDTRDRIGAFLTQAGGWVLSEDGKQAIADSPENAQALEYVRKLLAEGVAKYPKQIGAGDGTETFGQGKAAMTIEGNWMVGGMRSDYPDVKYRTVPLPAGPKGNGTLSFTQCWGIAAKSQYQQQAQDLVNALMTPQQQIVFAEAFGVLPSRISARPEYVRKFPEQQAFLDGADYAHGPVTLPKMDPVLTAFDTGLQGLPEADPKQILKQLQENATAALGS